LKKKVVIHYKVCNNVVMYTAKDHLHIKVSQEMKSMLKLQSLLEQETMTEIVKKAILFYIKEKSNVTEDGERKILNEQYELNFN